MLFALLIDGALLVAAGAGPLTTRLARGLRQGALALHRRAAPAGRLRLLAAMGILLSAFSLWVLLLWGRYLLLFSAEAGAGGTPPPARRRTSGSASTSPPSVSTLGMGDLVPQGPAWRGLAPSRRSTGCFW